MFENISAANHSNWKLWLVCAAIASILATGLIWIWGMTRMPLSSYRGPLQPLSDDDAQLVNHLSNHVKYLSETIGERNLQRPGTLQASKEYIRRNLDQSGYVVTESTYSIANQEVSNLEARRLGQDRESSEIIVGAHYDSVIGTPGANDNATGVAAVLELARLFQTQTLRKSLRFVLNEEPPYFQTDNMGSLVYARQLRRDRVPVAVMISLETIGYYSEEHGSQKYPPLLNFLYPDQGDFIGFVANPESREVLGRAIRTFRESTRFPSEGIAAPPDWPGIGWSDHWSFWQERYPAIMITDTAPFRYPYYHKPQDTVHWISFEKMARVVGGMSRVIQSLAMER